MRKLVTVRNIVALRPIDGADFIEVAEIDGWQCIVKKGEFSEGDPCVYFEIDSFLPADDSRYEFLVKRGTKTDESGRERIRIKSMKMKGEISQGLALPISAFPELEFITWEDEDGEYVDHSEMLDVIKFERPEPQQANAAGNWPEFLQKTDEDRIQNSWGKYSNIYKETTFVPTLKLDGSSCTVALVDERVPGYELTPDEPIVQGMFTKDELETAVSEEQPKALRQYIDRGTRDYREIPVDVIVCSRNLQLKFDPENHFWKAVLRGSITTAITRISEYLGRPVAIQGEVCGPGIQGNKEKLLDYEFYAFNIYDILNRRYLDYAQTTQMFDLFDIQHVPEIEEPFKPFERFSKLKDALAYADGPSLNAKVREGVVFKSIGEQPPVSFKVISNKFLLSGGDN